MHMMIQSNDTKFPQSIFLDERNNVERPLLGLAYVAAEETRPLQALLDELPD